MQKIVPHLWFDTEAKEAVAWYVSIFPDSSITYSSQVRNTPSGDCDILAFKLWGHDFEAISAGPYFKPTPAISFMVNFDPQQNPAAEQQIDDIWTKLLDGGTVRMPLQEYPFSKRYGWIEDKYGFSWQLILTNPQGDPRPSIIPALLFVSEDGQQADAAIDFYTSLFPESQRGTTAYYPAGMEPNSERDIMFADFTLHNQWFAAMDGRAAQHSFTFSEAVSLIVLCDDQTEVDRYWAALSAVPEAEQCGWLKDTFGVAWQIIPTQLQTLMMNEDPVVVDRVTQAMLAMKKLDIAKLEAAAKE